MEIRSQDRELRKVQGEPQHRAPSPGLTEVTWGAAVSGLTQPEEAVHSRRPRTLWKCGKVWARNMIVHTCAHTAVHTHASAHTHTHLSAHAPRDPSGCCSALTPSRQNQGPSSRTAAGAPWWLSWGHSMCSHRSAHLPSPSCPFCHPRRAQGPYSVTVLGDPDPFTSSQEAGVHLLPRVQRRVRAPLGGLAFGFPGKTVGLGPQKSGGWHPASRGASSTAAHGGVPPAHSTHSS